MDDPCTAYEERAAFYQHLAGMTREDAERKAAEDVLEDARYVLRWRLTGVHDLSRIRSLRYVKGR